MSEKKPMTVGELREAMKDCPDDTPVILYFRMMRRPHKVVAADYDEIINEFQICV